MVQLKVPLFGELEDKVWTTTPAFIIFIFTYDPTAPADVQVIAWLDPYTQDPPPFGDMTVIEEVVVPAGVIVKFARVCAYNCAGPNLFRATNLIITAGGPRRINRPSVGSFSATT